MLRSQCTGCQNDAVNVIADRRGQQVALRRIYNEEFQLTDGIRKEVRNIRSVILRGET